MTRMPYYAAILWALALGACSDQEQPTATSSPELKVTPSAVPASVACNFDSVKSLANTYFSPPAKQQAATFVTAMGSTAQSTAALTNGFRLLDLLGSVSRSSSPGVSTVGQRLARATIKCMFDASTSTYTALAGGAGINGVRFDLALSKASGGVFYVVGSDYPNAPQVLKGTIGTVTYSKVAPGGNITGTFPNITLGNNWSDIIRPTSATAVLIYGYQVTASPLVYEWATIDPDINFSPYALVSMCEGNTTDLMVQESDMGVLSFDQANLCDIANDATGRTATGFKSQFNNKSVKSLNVKFDPNNSPPATWQPLTSSKPIVVFVSVPDVGNKNIGVLGVCVYITGSANNGTPTNITSTNNPQRDPDCNQPPTSPSTTNPPYLSVKTTMTPGADHSVADFGRVTITKTGGLIFTATADVIDRSGAGSVFKKINVKP